MPDFFHTLLDSKTLEKSRPADPDLSIKFDNNNN